jgi:hypothetical protein
MGGSGSSEDYRGSRGDSVAGTSGTGLPKKRLPSLGMGIVYLLWQETILKSRKNLRGKRAFFRKLPKYEQL